MKLTKNMHRVDRAVRFLGGVLLMALAFTGTVGIWGWLGGILVATSLVSFCPIYKVLGINMCEDCG